MLKPNYLLASIRLHRPSWRTVLLRRPPTAHTPPCTPPPKNPRHYATATPLRMAKVDPAGGVPPTKWLEVLENTASAPWLNLVPQDHQDKLKRAYTLLYQIVLYLGRPQEEGKAEQFLVAFSSAIVPFDSEIGRARKAIAVITQAVVRDISSVPINSSLRTEKSEVFNIFGALQALHDMHLLNAANEEGVENWTEFWDRAQPVVLSLGMKLDEEGYGLGSDDSEENKGKHAKKNS